MAENSPETLAGRLLHADTRPRLLEDSERLLEAEVSSKKGVTGLLVKGAFKSVQAIKPGFVRGVLDALLDEWVAELEPEYEAWRKDGGGPFSVRLLSRRDQVAEALLRVTDRRAEGTKHSSAKTFYMKLRSGAKSQVVEALPQAARMLDRYLP